MKFWDLRTGICLKSIRAHDDTISSIIKIDNDTVGNSFLIQMQKNKF
jgi:hypothetical protein